MLLHLKRSGILSQTSPKMRGILRNIRNFQAQSPPYLSCCLCLFSQNQPKKTGLTASIFSPEANPIPISDFHSDRFADWYRRISITGRNLFQNHKPLTVIGKRKQLQTLHCLHIFQKFLFLLNSSCLTALHIFSLLLHSPGFFTQIGSCSNKGFLLFGISSDF